MRMIEASVTSQGQVTIPIEIRRSLGIEKRGKIAFVIDDDAIRLISPWQQIEAIIGSVPSIPGTSDDLDDEIEAAMAAEVERLRCSGDVR